MVSRYAARELPGAQHLATEIRQKSKESFRESFRLSLLSLLQNSGAGARRRPKRLQSCALESMLDTQGSLEFFGILWILACPCCALHFFDSAVWVAFVCFCMFLVLCQMHKTFQKLSFACYSDAELGRS